MPIYTKTGDKGKTSLGSGERVWKNSKRIEACGALDELNAVIGTAIAQIEEKSFPDGKYLNIILTQIQGDLFSVQSHIANPDQVDILSLLPEHTSSFEKEIDIMTEKIPALTHFILPGGGEIGSLFHVVRTVARRVERRIIDVYQEESVDARIVQYVNRLSDLFFTMARFTSAKEDKKETIWSKSLYLKK